MFYPYKISCNNLIYIDAEEVGSFVAVLLRVLPASVMGTQHHRQGTLYTAAEDL